MEKTKKSTKNESKAVTKKPAAKKPAAKKPVANKPVANKPVTEPTAKPATKPATKPTVKSANIKRAVVKQVVNNKPINASESESEDNSESGSEDNSESESNDNSESRSNDNSNIDNNNNSAKIKTPGCNTERLIEQIRGITSIEAVTHVLKKFIQQNPDTIPIFGRLSEFITSDIGDGEHHGIEPEYCDIVEDLEEEVDEYLDMIENDFYAEVEDGTFSATNMKLINLLKKNKVTKHPQLLDALEKIYRRLEYLDQCESTYPKLAINYLSK